MISILKCFKHTPNKIKLNNTKLFSNLPYRGTFTINVSNKFMKLKEWWHNKFINSNKPNVFEDVITKQQYLEKIQDERREIGKHITDVRKLFIEKQDKIFQIKEYELTAKLDVLDKTEKELFAVLSNKIRGSYEKEKEKSKYTNVIIVFSEVFHKISTNVEEEKPSYLTSNNVENNKKNAVFWGGFGLAFMFLICCCC